MATRVDNLLPRPLQSHSAPRRETHSLPQRVWRSVTAIFKAFLITLQRVYHAFKPFQASKVGVHADSPLYHHFRSESSFTDSESTERPCFVLAIDGGGIRGAVPAAFIADLEKDLGIPIATAFDCIAGSSTGGILTGAYATPKENQPDESRFTAEEISDFYLKHGPTIFTSSYSHQLRTAGGLLGPKYDGQALDSLVSTLIGETTIKECRTNVLMTSYCMEHRKAHLFQSGIFRNVTHSVLNQYATTSGGDTKVHTAVRATSAAPVYLPPIPFGESCNLVDGGLATISPTPLAILQLLRSDAIDPDRKIVMLSLGTGSHTMQPVAFSESSNWGIPQWIEPIIGTMCETNTMMSNIYMDLIAKDPRVYYMRYQVNLSPEQEPLDSANPAIIQSLAQLGHDAYKKAIAEGFKESFIDPVKAWHAS